MASERISSRQLAKKLKDLSKKQLLLLTALVTLLPIAVGLILWALRLPSVFSLYLTPDSREPLQIPLIAAILGIPLVCLLGQLGVCFLANREKERSILHPTWWMIPTVSHLTSYMTCALAMGASYTLLSYGQLLLGLVLTFVGSCFPGIKPNAAVGIRVPWAFTSRHNWRATHRFSGYCWMIGGLLMALVAFLPTGFGIQLTNGVLLSLLLLPTAFSFLYYLRQKIHGDPLHHVPRPGKGLLAVVVLVVLVILLVLFTGSLRFDFHEDSLTIKASYYEDFTVDYRNIETVEYHEGDVEGSRIGGAVSVRLQMGYYNDEVLDTYTRYTYRSPKACVLVTLKDRLLVISGKTTAETQTLYQQLLSKIQS